MDQAEIDNQIQLIMEDERPKTKDHFESDFSEADRIGKEPQSATRLNNQQQTNKTTLQRNNSTKYRENEVDQVDFELPSNKNMIEIDETEMKSMKSDANFRYKGKLAGVPDMTKVRESYDKLGKSVTDDMIMTNATKVNKNPKLETSKGAKLGALASVDFDSEKQVNNNSVEIEIDSVADIVNKNKQKTNFETPNNNLRNSIAAPTIAADNKKSII